MTHIYNTHVIYLADFIGALLQPKIQPRNTLNKKKFTYLPGLTVQAKLFLLWNYHGPRQLSFGISVHRNQQLKSELWCTRVSLHPLCLSPHIGLYSRAEATLDAWRLTVASNYLLLVAQQHGMSRQPSARTSFCSFAPTIPSLREQTEVGGGGMVGNREPLGGEYIDS